MADEFPTLEVALAVCVAWLGWRGWVLARGAARFDAQVDRLAAALQRGEEPDASSHREAQPAWVGYLARAALAAAQSAETSDAKHDPMHERARRIRRRLRSAAARDLVVCAVLLGALAYAHATDLGVSRMFFVLGALSSALLLVAVGLRLWFDARVGPVRERLAHAASGHAPSMAASAARASCPSCGAAELVQLSAARDLGKKLRTLGVVELVVCGQCGHVGGRVVRH